MAFTTTNVVKTVHGNQNCWQGTITADAASGVVSFGFGAITHAIIVPASATTAILKYRLNATAAGVAALGTIGISGVASGDEFFATVYGR